MNIIVSKAGIHCVGPKRTGYAAFLKRINVAGRRLSIVKCRDDFGAMDEPLALWPDTLTIGAVTAWDDASYNVNVAFRNIMKMAAKNPKVKYWEYFNEREDVESRIADFYIALLPRLNDVGIGLCMFNSSNGRPQYAHIDPQPYQHIARVCQFAKENGYNAILGLHEYVSLGGTIGRFAMLADYLERNDALVPVAITECGYETYPGSAKFVKMVKGIDPIYMADKRVIGCAYFTLGGGGWAGSNYQSALPALAEYIATVTATT